MIIKCALSVPAESIKYYAQQFSELSPLPEYISKKGPYINDKEGAAHQIITIFHFNESKLGETQEFISKHLDFLQGLPGFSLSARIYGPRPCHVRLREEGGRLRL